MPLRSGIKPTTLPEAQWEKLRKGAFDQRRTMLDCLAEAVDRWAGGKVCRLAADLLDLSADRFGNDVCTDWDPPKDWTTADREAFSWAHERANNSPQDYEAGIHVLDNWVAMLTVAAILRGEVSLEDPPKEDR